MKYFFLALVTTNLFAQDLPLGDVFFIKGGISSRQFFIEQNEKRTAELTSKYSGVDIEKADYEKSLLSFEDKIKLLREKAKPTKQEKAFLAVSSCLLPVMKGKPKKGAWGEDSVHTCAYTTNIDPRLLRQTEKGKPLGDEKEIMEKGDELSRFYLTITKSIPTSDTLKKFKEYENSLMSIKSSKEDTEKKKSEIAELQKRLEKREEIEKKVENELIKCKTPLSLPLEKHKAKISENGSSELMREMFESAVSDITIPDESYAKHQDQWLARSWQELMKNGFCPVKKKKDGDCEHCQGQMEKKISQIESFLETKHNNECSDKSWNGMNYRHLRIDQGPTSLSVQNKDRKKGIEHMRKVVMTNLAQGLPVGAKRMDKYESIIAVKPVKNECHYQVKNYSNGETFWIEEESMFEYLKELHQLNRSFL